VAVVWFRYMGVLLAMSAFWRCGAAAARTFVALRPPKRRQGSGSRVLLTTSSMTA
jgi:hypothetical protein